MTSRPQLLAAALLTASACGDPRSVGGLAASSGCEICHGAPPATGAHLVHATPASTAALAYGAVHVLEDVAPSATAATRYDFGCGSCHPLDPARHHAARRVQVELDPAGAPAGSLRALNLPGARYDPATRTCSGVSCHASGQDPAFLASVDPAALASTFRTTPPWDAPAGSLGCDGCHGNPPRYASGGAGAPDANSHLVLAAGAWESGHLLGLPGAFHGSKHGDAPDEDAAPITCQTCHADTVDPSATGRSGFYWLDTAGAYQLPGGDPARLGTAWYANLRCTTCHDGARAPAGAGRVLPLRHVNGRRDVVFDRRRTVPALPWAPAGASAPTRPYWVTDGRPGVALPLDATYDGTTLSLHLGSATYEPATKTCTSVACHLSQASVRWGAPHGTCVSCHVFSP